jgi:diguanylate cyclase (GGDEF)-like protein/PAS domain S-box-containing protein
VQPIDTSLTAGELLSTALRDLPAASLITDSEQRILFANRAFEVLSGYSLSELLGSNCRILQGGDTDVATVGALREALHSGQPFRGQILNYRKDGTPFWNLLTVTPLRNEEMAVTHFVSVQLDVTESVDRARTALENRELIDHIRHTAEIDRLTGLATRAVLQRHLTEALEVPEVGFVGVAYCGVDRFEWINDALGHRGGDEALRRIADILRAACPPPAVVSRSGGDEFIIVLPAIREPGDLTTFARDIEERFRTALTVHGREVYVTLSIGCAVARRGGPTDSIDAAAERIIREADSAMYRVKQGRHGQGMDSAGFDLLKLDADLHHAIDRGEIVAYFQPQYDSRIGNLTGYEALARWHHPEHGSLAPDRFIPLAEADGLIDRLGEEMLEQACRFADLAAADRPLQMQVNVSMQQLGVPGLAGRIRRALAEYPDRAWSLTIEITESALILDHDLVHAELERIRDLGVGVSIDDFGSGYSSLSQLRDLPATELKIDKSFVHREDAVGTSLLTAIVALANSLDLTVVAEGIETRSQLATLRGLGCDRLQGLYLCPPLIAEEALAARPDIAALLPSSR